MLAVQFFRDMVPLRAALLLAVGGLTVTMTTHAAILAGRIPCTDVSGGRVTDPARGRRVAVTSICSLVPVAVLAARGLGAAEEVSQAERALLGVLAVAALASVPVQALGTRFERRYMAPTAAALAIGLGRLAIER